MLKIYLDNCCYNRPFDPPSNPMIVFEASAKMLIQSLVINKQVKLVNSYVVYEEVSAITYAEKRSLIMRFLDTAGVYVAKDRHGDVLKLATEIMKTGIKYMDAAHIACSIVAGSDYLITTDRRLLKYKSDIISVINPVDFIRIWEERSDD